jgi:hypothetical protein
VSEVLHSPISAESNIINLHSSPRPKVGDFYDLPYSPVDYGTGVPLIIHPNAIGIDRHLYPNDLHHPYYPKNDLLKDVSLSSLALRHSRVQVVSWDAHHNYYHGRNGFRGPDLSIDDEAKFKLVVLSSAKFIPKYAVGFNKEHEPYVTKLSATLRQKLWSGNQIKVDSPNTVRDFLKDYIFRQSLDVSESTIDEFVNTKDQYRRWKLGHVLVAEAARQATDSLNPVYAKLRSSELIPRSQAKNAARFVLSSLIGPYKRQTVIRELQKKLILQIA